MKWTLILLPALFWATSDMISRFAAKDINPFLGGAILSLAMMTFLFLGFFISAENPFETILNTNKKTASIMLFLDL